MNRKNWKNVLTYVQNVTTKRFFLVIGLAVPLFLVTLFGLISQWKTPVVLHLNGEVMEVKTKAHTVEELLQELDIAYTAYDEVKPNKESIITTDLEIFVKTAIPVRLQAYGNEEKTIQTTVDTVEELLKKEGISLEEGDVPSPGLQEALQENMLVQVDRYTEDIQQEEQVIPYQVIRKSDDNMLTSEQKVVTKGQEGKLEHQIKVSYKNDQEVSREIVASNIIQEKRDEIVAVGTITTVARGNYQLAPRKVLDNVTLTAYSAGVEHTGKTPDHPQYAMTSSGQRAADGRTVAVDPSLIPMGSWIYIDGLGLRRAEDTGGAVKGKKIDVYFEDNQSARQFGTKRGYKVFVLDRQMPQQIKH